MKLDMDVEHRAYSVHCQSMAQLRSIPVFVRSPIIIPSFETPRHPRGSLTRRDRRRT